MNAKASLLGLLIGVAALVGLISREELFDPNPITIGLQVLAALLMIWRGSPSGCAASTPPRTRPRAGS